MFTLLLLLIKMGGLVALLNSTDQTVTVSKNLAEQVNITDPGEQCNVKCHLRNLNLDAFPACLSQTIEELDLSFNSITVIEDHDVVDLSKLRILSLAHNQIKEIHWGIHVLPELESLDLSNNLLKVVPKCLMLKNLRKLSLAENLIFHIQPFAFSCFPNLMSLNLSFTLIGAIRSTMGDIAESAFALNATQAQEDSLKSLQLLDLSGTDIRSVNHLWSKDLPNLRELRMKEMTVMEVLEDDLITSFPHLTLLNCANSKGIHDIRTEIFENAANLKYLNFQNCNLKDLSPWNITSESLTIDLRGNPLTCDCKLQWLLSDQRNLSLIRPNETFCSYLKGDVSSISLLELHKQCKLMQTEPNIETQDSVTSNTAVTESDFLPGTTEDSLTSPITPPTIGQKYFLLENTTDFTATVSENNSATSFPITQSGMNTPGTSESDYLPKEITLPINATDRTLTEHKFPESGSSNGEHLDIPRDYPEEYEEEETVTTVETKMTACDYNHCRHLQTPCSELQLLSPCLCPGLSSNNIIPDPPYVQGVFEITDTSAQILWCSPNSVVEKYQLVYQPKSGASETVDNIYMTMRQYTLYNLVPYTTYKVCVLAFNKKGHSVPINTTSSTSCTEFETRPSYILILSIVSTLAGLFLVTIAVLSTCLYKACKNNMVGKYDTRLVSYKNPAFEYQCTIPSYH
ncbi:leucine-rich repeat neuronal protein 4-like [Bufo bufo]|uniref:leucine-rich repeat neuronal protein 4-like n=2 Tax=Bufo bufo TaxID=8384 RepID=UPI001ABDD087|nr:leucine-rich repeat neuronal protein 4-like [Bufo bufo]